jgi:hypothetical protein
MSSLSSPNRAVWVRGRPFSSILMPWRAFHLRFCAIGPVRCLFSSLLSTWVLCLSRCGGKPRFLFSILFLFRHFLFRLLFSAGSCVPGSNQRLRSHLSSSSPSFRALISLDFPSRVIANLNAPCVCFCLSLLSHFFHACWLVFSAYFPHSLSGGRDAMFFSSRYFSVSWEHAISGIVSLCTSRVLGEAMADRTRSLPMDSGLQGRSSKRARTSASRCNSHHHSPISACSIFSSLVHNTELH